MSQLFKDKELFCYACGHPLGVEKITFRTLCDKCFSYQHCCLSCFHYSPGKPNDCAIPDTDLISDRKAMNFCDAFTFGALFNSDQQDKYEELKKKAKRFFGEE